MFIKNLKDESVKGDFHGMKGTQLWNDIMSQVPKCNNKISIVSNYELLWRYYGEYSLAISRFAYE